MVADIQYPSRRRESHGLLAAIGALLLGAAIHARASCNDAAPSAAAAGGAECAHEWIDHNLRLNDIQAIGTHASYKQYIPPDEMLGFKTRNSQLAFALDYGKDPLPQQLDAGARLIELDVWDDPMGGWWLRPPGPLGTGYASPPWSDEPLKHMREPGFKVMERPDVDFHSSCVTLAVCLTTLRAWSSAHPSHTSLQVVIRAHDGALEEGSALAPKFDAAAFDRLDAAIRSVFSADALVTPDDVRGSFATLREAVLAGRWPTLQRCRGKLLFVLTGDSDKVALYRGSRKSLEGRSMFVYTTMDSPAAAFVAFDDPIIDAPRIRSAVDAGFIVRTRADADTLEARDNDPNRRDTAMNSAAQFIVTDYLVPNERLSHYHVHFDGATSIRCNPHRMQQRCDGVAVD